MLLRVDILIRKIAFNYHKTEYMNLIRFNVLTEIPLAGSNLCSTALILVIIFLFCVYRSEASADYDGEPELIQFRDSNSLYQHYYYYTRANRSSLCHTTLIFTTYACLHYFHFCFHLQIIVSHQYYQPLHTNIIRPA